MEQKIDTGAGRLSVIRQQRRSSGSHQPLISGFSSGGGLRSKSRDDRMATHTRRVVGSYPVSATHQHLGSQVPKPLQRVRQDPRPLSAKPLRNHWITLSSFFTWPPLEFELPSPMPNAPASRFGMLRWSRTQEAEIERLLKTCDYLQQAETDRRRKLTTQRATAHHDRASM